MTTAIRSDTKIRLVVLLPGLLVLLLCLPAMAHDPLSDEHEQQHHPIHHDEAAVHTSGADNRRSLTAARQLVLKFRETGDDQALDAAWALLEPALAEQSSDPETLVTAAFIAQSRHQFDAALQFIDQALAINNHDDEAWLLRASIHLVRGESAAAATACRQLRQVPPLVLLTCKARIALAEGDQQIALARLLSVLAAVDTARLPAVLLAWSYSVAGDLAVAANEKQQAVALYEKSLGLAERTQVRAALADVLLAEANYESAWQSLALAPPALPLLVRQLIAARKMNRIDSVQPVVARVQREFEAWIADEDWLHAREMARFFIDVVERPKLARRLALINIELQREPEDILLEMRTRS